MEDGTNSQPSSQKVTHPSWPEDYLDGFYKAEYDPEICPVRQIVKSISDKWTILILASLKADRQRFSQIKQVVPDVSQRVLTESLRKLERDGFVLREVTPTIPPRVDYELTEMGRSLVGELAPLARWSDAHREKIIRARNDYDRLHGTK